MKCKDTHFSVPCQKNIPAPIPPPPVRIPSVISSVVLRYFYGISTVFTEELLKNY